MAVFSEVSDCARVRIDFAGYMEQAESLLKSVGDELLANLCQVLTAQ